MKKMLVLAAVALVTTPAFASKARLNALQNPAHTSDTRDVFARPDQALVHGEFATLEVGGTAGTPNAEGGFSRKMGDNGALGAYLGNKKGLAHDSLSQSASYTFTIQNPLNVYYANKMGDLAWGLGLQYANSENKIAKSKSSAMGLTASATSNAGWNAQVSLGLTGEATIADTTKVEQSSPMSIGGGYQMDSLYVYAGYDVVGAKTKVSGTGTGDKTSTTMKVGAVNSHKKDGADFFYGIEYNSNVTQEKTAGTKDKTEKTMLPVIVGIEADAASWLVVRGSITQNVLMGSTKTTPDGAAATTDTSMTDNTVVAGGMGLKLGKFTVDGTLAGAAAGKLGSDANFMADLGITYKF